MARVAIEAPRGGLMAVALDGEELGRLLADAARLLATSSARLRRDRGRDVQDRSGSRQGPGDLCRRLRDP
jgi:hypothetical protein